MGSPVAVEHAGHRVGLQAGERAETAGQHLDRVERALLDRGQRRVGLVVGVAGAPVERADAAAEFGILADGGVLVELGDRAGQSGGVDAALTREFRRASCRA